MRRQCYLAGKYSGTDDEIAEHLGKVLFAAMQLAQRAWFPIVPHCSMSHATDWNVAMLKDRMLLLRELDLKRDALVLLPEWEQSKGARLDREWVHTLGLTIMTFQEALDARPIM